tara:strand:+ start:554 stop:1147 length:594 start_codon:yes stop_codon:yes gene_type:complete
MAFATIDVTKGITGTIPVANGGTGLTSGTSGQFLKFTGSTTVASAAVDAGKVLQVLSNTFTSNSSTSSSTFSTLGISQAITPSATNSKILVIIDLCGGYTHNSASTIDIALRRTGGASGDGNILEFGATAGYGSSEDEGLGFHIGSTSHLDSPGVTSAVTYTAQWRNSNNSGNVYINHWVRLDSRPRSTLTVMEIAA